MKSLLTALDEGRLVELPDPDKEKSLEYLALLIEAVPDIQTRTDIVQEVKQREKAGNTALGKGVACPHARKSGEGELLCAIGWSPQGIDYGASDGQKVHLVVMYYVPDSQRNSYLKEVSGLAKAILNTAGIDTIVSASDIHAIRNQLLDWVGYAIDSALPDAKARMIRLQAKEAALTTVPGKRKPYTIVPFSILAGAPGQLIVLAHEEEFVRTVEAFPGLAEQLKKSETFELGAYQIAVRAVSSYAAGRLMHDCVAVRIEN